jgi:hypothetical protein
VVELQSTGGEKLYEHGQNIFFKAGYALLSSRRSCWSMVQVNAGYHHVKGVEILHNQAPRPVGKTEAVPDDQI